MPNDHDILIVGGGLVGASLACALGRGGWRVLQVEAEAGAPGAAAQPVAPLDQRHFALARRSVRTLDAIGVWPHARGAAHPIRTVEVSSRGGFGSVRIEARELGVDALGHTLPASALGAALAAAVAATGSVERRAPARLVAIEPADDAITAELDVGGARQRVRAALVVGADGTESAVRAMAGIGAQRHDYAQTAIASAVELSRAHDDCAYERFTDAGPIALLPLAGQRAGLVWSVAADAAPAILALDDRAFLDALQQRFGFRAGRFARVGRRQPWPLRLTTAEALCSSRVVLVGNAAQTIHPLGAQGFNLGLRDVAELAARLEPCSNGRGDPGASALLAAYAAARAADRDATLDFSDGLTRLFSRNDALTGAARGAGLAAFAAIAPLRRELAYALMGYRADDAA